MRKHSVSEITKNFVSSDRHAVKTNTANNDANHHTLNPRQNLELFFAFSTAIVSNMRPHFLTHTFHINPCALRLSYSTEISTNKMSNRSYAVHNIIHPPQESVHSFLFSYPSAAYQHCLADGRMNPPRAVASYPVLQG